MRQIGDRPAPRAARRQREIERIEAEPLNPLRHRVHPLLLRLARPRTRAE